ncbi:MAG: hypothetical protein OEZ36_14130, partial [Spirochaetota bacterium]|nr:hypothetical protein [Spirochaetota bacterium]
MAENILLKPGEHQKVKWLLHMIIRVIVMGAMLIALSGRWDYWQGWVFLGVNLISATLIILAFDLIDVLKERMKPGPGIKSWDKVFWGFYGLSGTATFIIPPLDIRFAWLEPVSIIVYIPAFLIFLMT